MEAQKTGDWDKLSNILNGLSGKVEKAAHKATLKEAHFLRKQIVEGIKDQAPGGKQFLPLSATTIAVRKFMGFSGTKALIRTGDLRNSIQVYDGPEGVFVGVHRTAKGRGGKNMIDVAVVHEFGSGPIVVTVTDKMRRFLMAAFRKAGLAAPYGKGAGLLIHKVPKREFISPIFERFCTSGGSRTRIEREMTRLLTGVLS